MSRYLPRLALAFAVTFAAACSGPGSTPPTVVTAQPTQLTPLRITIVNAADRPVVLDVRTPADAVTLAAAEQQQIRFKLLPYTDATSDISEPAPPVLLYSGGTGHEIRYRQPSAEGRPAVGVRRVRLDFDRCLRPEVLRTLRADDVIGTVTLPADASVALCAGGPPGQ